MESVQLKYGIGSSNCVTRQADKLESPVPVERPNDEPLMLEHGSMATEQVAGSECSIREQALKLVARIEKREAEIYLKEKELNERAGTLVMVDAEREKLQREKAAAEQEKNVSQFFDPPRSFFLLTIFRSLTPTSFSMIRRSRTRAPRSRR